MADLDYALAWDFIEPNDGKPRQLRFQRNWAPKGSPETFDGTGQLIAVVADSTRTDNGDTLAISRPGVRFVDVHTAIEGWHDWAMITHDTVNLAEIRRRIHDAGLD